MKTADATKLPSSRAFPGTIDGTTGKKSNANAEPDTKAAGEPINDALPVPKPDKKMKDKLEALSKKMDTIDAKREEANAMVAEVREEIKNLGYTPRRFELNRKLAKLDQVERDRIDLNDRAMREYLDGLV